MQPEIVLAGYRFYQQYRKCNKDGCRTCENGGRGHGPYWFRRDLRTGIRKYIGRKLPDKVYDVQYFYHEQERDIEREMARHRNTYLALKRLHFKQPLQPGDADLIAAAGFVGVIYEPNSER